VEEVEDELMDRCSGDMSLKMCELDECQPSVCQCYVTHCLSKFTLCFLPMVHNIGIVQ
jgi:hypothetical protein